MPTLRRFLARRGRDTDKWRTGDMYRMWQNHTGKGKMTIRNLEHYNAALWDFGAFDGCFGNTKIAFTDLDGVTERRGQFLVFEGKTGNAPVPRGQEIMFRAMVETGKFTIIIAWGEPNAPNRLRVMAQADGRTIVKEYDTANIDTLRGVVSRWYRYANGFTDVNHHVDNTY